MWDPLTRTLLVLTFVTGMLDAIGFLALGHVFVAMQTGNVIFLGIGLGGAAGADRHRFRLSRPAGARLAR